MRRVLVWLVLAGCARSTRSEPARAPLELTYLGVAGWTISDGRSTILVDPYFSRVAMPEADAVIVPDEAAIAAQAPAKANLIVVGHSHFDHLLDVPAVAKRTGAQIMGTQVTIEYAFALGVPRDRLISVKGRQELEFDHFSVHVIPSLHSLIGGPAASNSLAEVKPPLTLRQFVEGGTVAYLIRISGHQVLVFDTANFIEDELKGLHPDIAIVATGARDKIPDYACRLMRVLGGPRVVLATHFDAFTRPLGPRQMEIGDAGRADLEAFVQEIHACAPQTRVVIPEHLRVNRVE